ncbi:pantothenate kinase [Kytococcus aerolatus]|uniref:Pantothenate kinase n=2 Tax=Kytococcus aerolatus TaxID=592308 RepID=A0A212U7W8_9MICO|nr:pantothenate kinase [Kytococcus aerolatus]
MHSPYVELGRDDWARLRQSHPMSLTAEDIARIEGIGDRIDAREVEEIYLPLSRLINLHVRNSQSLRATTSEFLGETPRRIPFIIGVAGSVAVGKSTTARLLHDLMARWPETPRVQLVTTDGFLFPNEELEKRGLMERKGFPESYDRRKLLRFVSAVKAGSPQVSAPVYSHLVYDIVPDEEVVVDQPDVLIVEGLNVLQPPVARKDGSAGLAVSDFFDFSVYVDARVEDIKSWYLDRFQKLRRTAFADPESFFHRYASMSAQEAEDFALSVWDAINGPNLQQNIAPTRGRATAVLTKDENHAVHRVLLRKV